MTTRLLPGVYVSRKDHVGSEVLTTFDLRMTRPNFEPVMNTAEVHTIEHLGRYISAKSPGIWSKDRILWPYGMPHRLLSHPCRGLYFIRHSAFSYRNVEFIRDYKGEVPGACAKDCGNYLDMNLPMANFLGKKYLENTVSYYTGTVKLSQ